MVQVNFTIRMLPAKYIDERLKIVGLLMVHDVLKSKLLSSRDGVHYKLPTMDPASSATASNRQNLKLFFNPMKRGCRIY